MSDTVTPQGVLCVLRQPSYDLGELLGRDGTFLVLEDIQDPGNLGTMLRTGEGAGITAVIMSKRQQTCSIQRQFDPQWDLFTEFRFVM